MCKGPGRLHTRGGKASHDNVGVLHPEPRRQYTSVAATEAALRGINVTCMHPQNSNQHHAVTKDHICETNAWRVREYGAVPGVRQCFLEVRDEHGVVGQRLLGREVADLLGVKRLGPKRHALSKVPVLCVVWCGGEGGGLRSE
jgi:hypothetical protein